eukprot:gene7494-16703_t
MPGHGVSGASEKAAREAVATLTTLIEEHDAVFLLTDSREARWLPTVIAAHQNKICLTAAVGFDTFVAMRHGISMAVCSAVVEMLISMLHHPLGAAVPHETDEVDGESPLGAVPHQIRGFMAGFRQMLIGGQAFDKCTACSKTVVAELAENAGDLMI